MHILGTAQRTQLGNVSHGQTVVAANHYGLSAIQLGLDILDHLLLQDAVLALMMRLAHCFTCTSSMVQSKRKTLACRRKG